MLENPKSNPPKKIATIKELAITIKVYLIAVSRVGQLTFFISNFTSLKKEIILETNPNKFALFIVFVIFMLLDR